MFCLCKRTRIVVKNPFAHLPYTSNHRSHSKREFPRWFLPLRYPSFLFLVLTTAPEMVQSLITYVPMYIRIGVLLVFRRRTVRPSVGHSVKNLEFQKKLNENLSPKIGWKKKSKIVGHRHRAASTLHSNQAVWFCAVLSMLCYAMRCYACYAMIVTIN